MNGTLRSRPVGRWGASRSSIAWCVLVVASSVLVPLASGAAGRTPAPTPSVGPAGPPALVATASVSSPGAVTQDTVLNFTGAASGGLGPYTYFWYFGDGANSSTQDPSHGYDEPGLYLAVLIVADTTGNRSYASVPVTVNTSLGGPSVTASASTQIASAGTSVSFTAMTQGFSLNASYSWSFSDGSSAGTQDAVHRFSTGGVYPVVVGASDIFEGPAFYFLTIFIKPGAALAGGITSYPGTGYPPLRVELNGTITGGWVDVSCRGGEEPLVCDLGGWNVSWKFGDGGVAFGALDVVHTYTSAGDYTARLNVSDSFGQTDAPTLSIVVAAPPALAAPTILSSVSGGSSPLSVWFNASATGGVAPLSFSWNFGDSATDYPGASVQHTFAADGTYKVTLTVRDSDGQSANSTTLFTVGTAASSSAPLLSGTTLYLLGGVIATVVIVAAAVMISRRSKPPAGDAGTP